jgi:hypothetical protein
MRSRCARRSHGLHKGGGRGVEMAHAWCSQTMERQLARSVRRRESPGLVSVVAGEPVHAGTGGHDVLTHRLSGGRLIALFDGREDFPVCF